VFTVVGLWVTAFIILRSPAVQALFQVLPYRTGTAGRLFCGRFACGSAPPPGTSRLFLPRHLNRYGELSPFLIDRPQLSKVFLNFILRFVVMSDAAWGRISVGRAVTGPLAAATKNALFFFLDSACHDNFLDREIRVCFFFALDSLRHFHPYSKQRVLGKACLNLPSVRFAIVAASRPADV